MNDRSATMGLGSFFHVFRSFYCDVALKRCCVLSIFRHGRLKCFAKKMGQMILVVESGRSRDFCDGPIRFTEKNPDLFQTNPIDFVEDRTT